MAHGVCSWAFAGWRGIESPEDSGNTTTLLVGSWYEDCTLELPQWGQDITLPAGDMAEGSLSN